LPIVDIHPHAISSDKRLFPRAPLGGHRVFRHFWCAPPCGRHVGASRVTIGLKGERHI